MVRIRGSALSWPLLVASALGCEASVVVPWNLPLESGPSEADYPRRAADAYCDRVADCCGVASEKPCASALYDELRAYAQSNQHEHIRFDPSRAQACIDALGALRCDEGEPWAPALDLCKHVYVGELGPGEWCTNPRVCSTQGGVDVACSLQNGCILIEEAFAHEACGKKHECVAGTTCEGGTCVTLPLPGEPCPDHQCAPGAYCTRGTCSSVKDPAEACVGDNECSLGMCIAERCGSVCDLVR